jgi:hypothetical protein
MSYFSFKILFVKLLVAGSVALSMLNTVSIVADMQVSIVLVG